MGGVTNLSDSNATNDNDETIIDDSLNGGGIDSVLNLTTTAQEGKVNASRLTGRKTIIAQALDNNIKWGFSNTTQSFDLFKNQVIILPIGEDTEIWFKMSSGTGDIAFSEIA